MDTDQIVESYFETLFPNPHLRTDNLIKLGHFIQTPETILIIQGNKSTGKMTLFRILTLLTGELTRQPYSLFMNDKLYQWDSRLISITSSSRLLLPFPNLKPIIIQCQRYFTLDTTLPIIINQHQITTSLARILTKHAQKFERYSLIPEYQSVATFLKNRRQHNYRNNRHLYSRFLDQMV